MATATEHLRDELRILLVEDARADAELEVRELRRAGLRFSSRVVEVEPDFRRELDVFDPHVILSDFSLPRFSGLEALAISRQMRPDTPFIFVSGTIGEENAVAALRNGATDYVLKTNLKRFGPAVLRAVDEARERTARLTAERRAKDTEHYFSLFMRHLPAAAFTKDPQGRFTFANATFEELTGRTDGQLIGLTSRDLYPPDYVGPIDANDRKVIESGQPYRVVEKVTFKGIDRFFLVTKFPIKDEADKITMIGGVAVDITDRILQENRLERLSRIREVLSSLTAAIIRLRTPEDLCRELCRIAIDVGHFGMAWAGLVQKEPQGIRPVASHGAVDGFLEIIAAGRDVVGLDLQIPETMAVGEQRQIVIDEIETSDTEPAWRRAALDRGFHSCAALPLISGDKVAGVGVLFSKEPHFFDAEHIRLLSDLAADAALALERMEKQDLVEYLSFYDPLTGLANRTLVQERLQQFLHEATRNRHMLALMILDLERLHLVNESLGRGAGDKLLKLVAERLQSQHAPEQVGRIGMNSFIAILPDIRDAIHAARLVEGGRKNPFSRPFDLDGNDIRVSAKCGVAVFPADGLDSETLIRNAEAALTQAKQTGDAAVYYTPTLNADIAQRLALETKLRRAIEEKQFVLYYQPKVNVTSGKIVGVEALIRWKEPESDIVPPSRFIPILEETGMILDVGKWALEEAVRVHRKWKSAGLNTGRIAVNVSALQLRQKDFVKIVEDATGPLEGDIGIDIEITETMLMHDITHSLSVLGAIRKLGVMISIDDFGTGYSSLSYLARLPIDYLKIDRSFINKIVDRADDLEIASAIISMANSLNLKTIAEGVENQEQAELLKVLGCHQMQGYLISRPLPEEKVVELFS